MTKPGFQNFARREDAKPSNHALPPLPEVSRLMPNESFDQYVRVMSEALAARDRGAQEVLRYDLTRAYADAQQIANSNMLFARFKALKLVADLPRPPKEPEQTLHALLKLAYQPSVASARHCRLKRLWKAGASVAQVFADLEESGSSPKGLGAKIDPASARAFGLYGLEAGDEFGLWVWVKATTPAKLDIEIVDRLEWPA